MIIAFVIWSALALAFVGIGVWCRRSGKAVGFYSNAEPPAVTDVRRYNKAVSRLWFVLAPLYEAMGVPFLFARQNSPVYAFTVLGVVFLMIAAMVAYSRIEAKYAAQARSGHDDSGVQS